MLKKANLVILVEIIFGEGSYTDDGLCLVVYARPSMKPFFIPNPTDSPASELPAACYLTHLSCPTHDLSLTYPQ